MEALEQLAGPRGCAEVRKTCAAAEDVLITSLKLISKLWRKRTGSLVLQVNVFFRALGFVYFVAFLIAHIQGPGLFGQDGLLPLEGATACFREFGGDTHGLWTRFARSPSLFHFFDCTDASLLFITSSSLFFSALLMIAGGVTVPVLLWLWLSYTTIQAAGQRFYTFTWDTLLLEVGFWAMPLTLPFFCPSFTCVKGSSRSTPEGLGAPSAPTAETAAATPADNSSSGDADAGRPPPTPGDGSASASRKPEKAEAQRPAPEDAGPVGSEGRAVRFLGSPRVQQGLRGLASPARAFFWCCRCLVSPGTPFLPPAWPTPWISVWGYRWLLFRLMFGAGLIKLRADTAWADLSAMKWHYETQPLPNPVAWFMHALPMPMHKFEVLVNHFVELILPFAVLAPWRQLRLFTGCVQILFQVAILFTGNLAFINWLTIVFAVFLFDDRFLMCFFPTSTLNRLQPLLKGCAGRWSIPPSDAAIGWLAAAGDASPRVSEHSEGTQDASTHKRASPNTRGHSLVDGSAHDGGEPAPEGVDSRTGSPQARAVSAGLREGLPWRLRGGPKCTGRSVRRMLALWGCWRIPLFLLCSAVLLASDALLLLLLEKESFAAVPSVVPFRSRAWESAGLVLLALSAAIALGMLTGVQGAPWYPLWGRRPSSAGPGAGQQRPLSLLASVSASASQEDTGSARETSASLRRGAEADSSDAPRDEKTADRERRDAPENAADGGETARLLWRKTEDVGALCFEVIVAGVVVCNLLVIHFRLGPSVGLGVLTGALFALLLFFAHRRCSNAFLVLRVMAEVGLVTLLTLRSIPVVENLLSPQQIMNDTYEPFNLVNSYGLFGFMTKQREELIVQGTYSRNPSLAPSSRDWKTYEFFCKPGGINRRPCIVTPYYYRLDWLMWFAAFRPDLQPPLWLLRMVKKLLANDAKTTALLLRNPFQGKSPPRFIRILRYDYHFAYKGKERKQYEQGAWWERKYMSQFLPPVEARMFRGD